MRAKPSNRTRRGMAVAVTVLTALGLTACGGTVSTNSFKGEEKAVAQRISDFQTDVTASDHKSVCQNDLAATVLAALKAKGSGCEAALKSQLAQIDIVELKVDSVKVTGRTASAVVETTWSGKTVKSTLVLTKEGSAWKIARLA
jgi:hypothetical protein